MLQILRLGFDGYKKIMINLMEVAAHLAKGILASGRPWPALTQATPFQPHLPPPKLLLHRVCRWPSAAKAPLTVETFPILPNLLPNPLAPHPPPLGLHHHC